MDIKRCISIAGLFLLMFPAFATHNRAGEISFRHMGGLKYEITVITYTEVGGTQADRPFLPIDWGDNSGPDSIARLPSKPQIAPFIQKNTYVKTHEYRGPGRYFISVEDPNRNAGIQNIPNSVMVPFYIESELIIDAFAGHNNSVQLLNPPIDFACVGFPFVHNPAAYDPDGDSVVFSLVESKGFNGVTVPGYTFPNAANSIKINSSTGELVWDYPLISGEYNVAIKIEEYKNGIRVGSVLRDMQITVGPPCEHQPPTIEEIPSLCVEAGKTLMFNVHVTDTIDGVMQKDGDSVWVSAFSGAFTVDPPAFFEMITSGVTRTGQFIWETSCNSVRKRPYPVVFKAVDNGSPSLSSFKNVNIQVVAPAPKNLTAEPVKNTAMLNWDKSVCSNALGYKIYRKLGGSSFVPDTCETGVPASTGFKLIHTDSSIDKTSFMDDDNGRGLILGLEYCYRIIAYFADGAESYSSEEVCVRLKKELPVITNVSVLSTDLDTGRIYLAWSKPTEHDTSVYPGPYRYLIRRKIWNENFVLIDSTPTINDTLYGDLLLNTEENEYTYIIDMYDLSEGKRLMGSSVSASSIYLNSLAEDNRLVIQWNEEVPWLNHEYVLLRRNNVTMAFDTLDTIPGSPYIDDQLANGTEYCYKLISIGEYLVDGLIKPIINHSQIHCNVPVDLVPPCPPVLTIDAIDCEQLIKNISNSQSDPVPCNGDDRIRETQLRWTNPNNACEDVDDVVEYRVYYKPMLVGNFKMIYSTRQRDDTTFKHIHDDNSIAGCYYVTAIDSFANESVLNDSVCIDNCPIYYLPNVFTPGNNDGMNDLFGPFPYCFIESVHTKIFNRWGQTVFETDDPDINWDGVNRETGLPAAEGVYFYVCKVNEMRLEGPQQQTLKGYVHLFRNQRTGEY